MVLLIQSFVSIYSSLFLIKPCHFSEIKIGVLLPKQSQYRWGMQRVMPAVDIAVEGVLPHVLPGMRITTVVRDTGCSSTTGLLAAIQLITTERVHALFGPVCDYALAPVARISPYWNIPVLTVGGGVRDFDDKKEYQLLTRVYGTYSNAAETFIDIAKAFNWTDFGLLYRDNKESGEGKSDCYFRIEALYFKLKQGYNKTAIWNRSFSKADSENVSSEILRSASLNAKVLVLCGSSDDVREIIMKAHDLKLDNGSYVFVNYDFFSSSQTSKLPWYREYDTVERNEKARKAYEILLTFSISKPTSSEYKQFSKEVKRKADLLYEDFTYGEDDVNTFVGTFHDAVVLYGLALNETLEANGSVTDGLEITSRMWNKTFQGITGMVSIDSNGDRKSDFSLMDMDPEAGEFKVVLKYFGKSAPPRILKCGKSNNSECQTADVDETVTETSTASTGNKVEDLRDYRNLIVRELVERLQLTLKDISKVIDEHNTSLSKIAGLHKQPLDSSLYKCSCPQALTSKGTQNTNDKILTNINSSFCVMIFYFLHYIAFT